MKMLSLRPIGDESLFVCCFPKSQPRRPRKKPTLKTNAIIHLSLAALLAGSCLISASNATNPARPDVKPRSLVWTGDSSRSTKTTPPPAIITTTTTTTTSTTTTITTTTTSSAPPVEQPDFEEPIGNHTVALGRDVQLSCKIRSLGNFRTAWLRVEDKGILTIHNNLITRNYRIGLLNNESGDLSNFVLTIRNVLPSDKGSYMCQINSVPMRYNVGHVDVLTPPSFDDATSDTPPATDHDGTPLPSGGGAVVIVPQGQSADLSCRASGHPSPTISWRREDGEPIVADGGQTDRAVARVEGPSLHLSRVGRRNSGAYLCIASNGVPPAASRRQLLDVQFGPIITLARTELAAQLGQPLVQLTCIVELNPVGVHHWYQLPPDSRQQNNQPSADQLDGLQLADSDKHEIVIKPMTSETVQMILNIRQVSRRDFGLYRCAASNALGSQSGTIRLTQSGSIFGPNSAPPERELNDQQDQTGAASSRAHSSISWLTTTLASTGLSRLKQDSPAPSSRSPLKQLAASMAQSIHGSSRNSSQPLLLFFFFLLIQVSIIILYKRSL